MTRQWPMKFASVVSIAALSTSLTYAAEIKVLSPTAMRGVMPDITSQFERSSKHKATIDYANVGEITKRIQKGGEAADVIIVSLPQIEELQKQDKVLAGSRSDIARVSVAVFVRGGAPKPDIGSTDAFKRALTAAKSIAYGDPAAGGVSGVHMARIVEKLGIAAEMKPKTRLFPNSQVALGEVAKGTSEIGIGLTSDTALVSGVDLIGALPTDLQNVTTYSAGIVASSKQADAAKAFINFLSAPAAKDALRPKGFDPR